MSSRPLSSEPNNHCVPLIDIFEDNEEPQLTYIVMPFLRTIDDPPFDTVADVMDFIDQLFEVGHCLVFLAFN